MKWYIEYTNEEGRRTSLGEFDDIEITDKEIIGKGYRATFPWDSLNRKDMVRRKEYMRGFVARKFENGKMTDEIRWRNPVW